MVSERSCLRCKTGRHEHNVPIPHYHFAMRPRYDRLFGQTVGAHVTRAVVISKLRRDQNLFVHKNLLYVVSSLRRIVWIILIASGMRNYNTNGKVMCNRANFCHYLFIDTIDELNWKFSAKHYWPPNWTIVSHTHTHTAHSQFTFHTSRSHKMMLGFWLAFCDFSVLIRNEIVQDVRKVC